MRKSSLLFILLCVCLILGGCSLALPESEQPESQDRFVGLWVALDYLDTTFAEGDDFPIASFGEEEENDILYLYSGMAEDESGAYHLTDGGNGLMDVKSHIHSSDEGESTAMEGTVYATKNASGLFVPYALYQRPDNTCYVGECLHGMQSNFHAGSSMSMEQERSRTVADNEGKTQEQSSKFTLNFVFIDQLQAAQAVFLDAEYTALKRVPLLRENKELAFPQAAELLVIEETYCDAEGETYITRSIYQRGDSDTEYHYLKWEGENGIVLPTTVSISGLLR